MRVELKTDARNERSRAALAGIGATFEGVFRRHQLMASGRVRDSAWYAVVDEDWPAVRERLRARLAAQTGAAPSGRPGDRRLARRPQRPGPLAVETVDYHTGGEPFRIIVGGVPPLEGATILERRRFALEHLDHVRRFLVYEPRGHADMYGCHVVPPERRRRRPRRRLLPQRGLLDGLRARDDRAGDLGPRERASCR